jgi:hypothetical protein
LLLYIYIYIDGIPSWHVILMVFHPGMLYWWCSILACYIDGVPSWHVMLMMFSSGMFYWCVPSWHVILMVFHPGILYLWCSILVCYIDGVPSWHVILYYTTKKNTDPTTALTDNVCHISALVKENITLCYQRTSEGVSRFAPMGSVHQSQVIHVCFCIISM